MSRLADYLFAVAIVFWVGALWTVGGIVAPVLFANVADRAFAGLLAGKLFAAVAWLGISCAAYLLIFLFVREGWQAFRSLVLWLVVLMLLLALAGYFGVAPVIDRLRADLLREVVEGVVRSRFQTWHGIASVVWLLQCVLGGGLVTQALKR